MPFGKAGFSTEYMKQKLCRRCGIDTLKYHPSKKDRAVPSKWYLRNEIIYLNIANWRKVSQKLKKFYSLSTRGINSNTSWACNGAKERELKNNIPTMRSTKLPVFRRRRIDRVHRGSWNDLTSGD